MSPIYLFDKNGGTMALKSKSNDINEEIIEEVSNVEQISFDDLEFEAEFEEEKEHEVYYTISGKEQKYNSQWSIFKNYECDVGDYLEGIPEITIFENPEKSYNALRLRVIDETTNEVLDAYLNFPKKDWPYVTGINKSFDFYRTLFDFIYSILRFQDETNVVDSNGEEINKFTKVNLENFAKFIDQKQKVHVKITEGNPDSDYNSWIVLNME